jgi:phage-related protein
LLSSLEFETLTKLQPAVFHPKALLAIRSFPKTDRRALGEAVLDLQQGQRLGMPLSRSMPVVGPGVHELRVRDERGIYRAFYILKFGLGVIVFHAFEKNTQKTSTRDIQLARRRLQEVL